MPLKDLGKCLWRWIWQDRVRGSPRDGAILRLAPPAIVLLADVPFEVVARRVLQLAAGPVIVYDCASDRSFCQLHVAPADPPRIVCIQNDSEVMLRPDDIEILSIRGPRG